MNSKIISLILAFLFVQIVLPSASADDDEYFEKSIYRALKNKNGQFNSEMQMTRNFYGNRCFATVTKDHEEKFSFKTNTGKYSIFQFSNYNSPEHNHYVNGKEIYSFPEKGQYCYSKKMDKYEMQFHLR